MRKSIKVISIIALSVAVVLTLAWPYIEMEFSGSAHYTEQDTREYGFYTPGLLKDMPRISPRYDFDFANITGPASQVHAIRFYDTTDSEKVDTYLIAAGYSKQENCHIEAVCWQGQDQHEIVTVSTLENPKALLVSVINNF
ncbi:hypothetical protein [Phytobacter sp. RSE-02]|uniref:hypothetical protein n=1 Tax=Phytobacter sp. RSE-02 TaxID=3229229 RepID=UPI00339D58B8